MKSLKGILLVIVLGLFLSAIGCATLEKGSGERVRLKEPRIKPLPEKEWTDEQQKLLAGCGKTHSFLKMNSEKSLLVQI